MQFHFFAGKGGVGKTTCAAASAVRPGFGVPLQTPNSRRILVVSTDPAHSLGDVLGVRLGARPKRVAASVDAVELNARRAFARWLNANRTALVQALEHGTWLDRSDVESMLDLTLPGIDELAAFLEIARIGGTSRRYHTIVVDTAPTGHALRLLFAPETVATVANLLDALQEEHRIIRDRLARVRRIEAADRLIELLASQAADTVAMLRDPLRAMCSWVLLPEELSIAESQDAITALERGGIHVRELIVNRVVPDDDPCPLCDARRREERKAIRSIRKLFARGRRLRLISASISEPRGIRALRSLDVSDSRA